MSVIKDNRLKLGLTMLELAKRCGVSEGTVSRWESGDIANMKQNNILSVANALGISPMDILLPERINSPQVNSCGSYKLFPVSISAGALEDVTGTSDYELISISDTILGQYARKKTLIVLRVNGDSMNKVIPNGSYIIVDTYYNHINQLSNNNIVVFSQDGSYSVKRFYNDFNGNRFLFKPDSTNEAFTAIEVSYSNAENTRLIGKVVKYIVEI